MNLWRSNDFERILAEIALKTTHADWPLKLAQIGESGRFTKVISSLLKRSYPSKPFIHIPTPGGVVVGDLRDRYSRRIAGIPDSEQETVETILRHCGGGKAFVDVGANLGALSIAVAGHGFPVLGIEPDPETARRLAAGFALNRREHCWVFPGAAGEAAGEISFFSQAGQTESASVHADVIGADVTERRVPVETIDRLAHEVGPVGFIKVDVEGHEPAVFRGAIETIRRDHPGLMFEYHWGVAPKLGWVAEDVTSIVEAVAPYRWSVLVGATMHAFPPEKGMGTVANILGIPKTPESNASP